MSVSLSELNSFNADPEQTRGTPAVLIDNRETLRNVMDAGHAKAANDWNKYNMFLKNYQEFAKTANTDFTGIMPTDSSYLSGQLKSIMGEALKDPSVIMNPLSNPTLHHEIETKLQGLNAEIAKSKSQNMFITAQELYKSKNPELNIEENNKLDLQYRNTPLKDRTEFTYKMPDLWNPALLGKAALSNAQVSFAESQFDVKPKLDEKGRPVLDANGKPVMEEDTRFIRTVKGKRADKAVYDKLWMAALNEQDKYGHRIGDVAMRRYKEDPENEKKFGNFENWYKAVGDSYYDPNADVTENKKEETKSGLAAQKFGYDVQLELLKNRGSRELEAYKHWLGQQDKKQQAKAMLQLAGGAVLDALKNAETVVTKLKDGTKVKSKRLRLTPQVLELYGEGETVKEDADGNKTITYKDKPDYVEYIPSKKEYKIVFLEKDESGNPIIGSNGMFSIKKDKKISDDQFMTTIANSILPKGKLAESYQYAKEEMGGNSLVEYILSGKLKGINVPSASGGGSRTETTSGVRTSTQYKQPVVPMK